jgi:hypothetical protein
MRLRHPSSSNHISFRGAVHFRTLFDFSLLRQQRLVSIGTGESTFLPTTDIVGGIVCPFRTAERQIQLPLMLVTDTSSY